VARKRRVTGPPDGSRAVAGADARKLEQVITNLVVNAVQATPPDGSIEIEISEDDVTATFSIRDTGAGISSDALPRVFEPFFTTKHRGTGLGLAIAQSIVDAHGGRIEIESSVEHGTCVRVHLPRPSLKGPKR